MKSHVGSFEFSLALCVGMSLFSSFFVLLLVLIEASPTSASVSNLGNF